MTPHELVHRVAQMLQNYPVGQTRPLFAIQKVALEVAEYWRKTPLDHGEVPFVSVGAIREIEISTATPTEKKLDFVVEGFLVVCTVEGKDATLVVLGDGVFIEEKRA